MSAVTEELESGASELTARERSKAERRAQILDAAATLIAERGLAGVRLEDIGKAVGISGPAVYRHFANKEAVLEELLVGISQHLRDGGQAVIEAASGPQDALMRLVDFHIDFALSRPSLISVQFRDLSSLPQPARHLVRQLQREYVETWVSVLCAVDPELDDEGARIKAHAGFGALNSTPHSLGRGRGEQRAFEDRARKVLRQMALAALGPQPAQLVVSGATDGPGENQTEL